MAKRFTDTEKWKKNWFIELSLKGKLLWMFVTDHCNHAGVCDFSPRLFSYFLGFQVTKETINELLINKIQWIEDDKFFIPSFIEFQYGILNPYNRAHKSVLDIVQKIENKPLTSPLQGAKDKEQDKDMDKDKDIISWRTEFKEYERQAEIAFNKYTADSNWMQERKKYHPNLDIYLSLEKAFNDFWGQESGWIYKKKSKSKEIDWESTMKNALTLKGNQVYEIRK